MPTLLPTDLNNNAIPAVRLKNNGAHIINASAVSACNATAFDSDTRLVSLYTTGPVYIRFGDEMVMATASDHYFPAGIYYDFAIGGGAVIQYSHIAVLAADSDCTVYISEKE